MMNSSYSILKSYKVWLFLSFIILSCNQHVNAQLLTYDGMQTQFAGGFNPSVGHGGFGGADNCTVARTPVVFIHGNGDNAINWDFPVVDGPSGYQKPQKSVYDLFISRGYKPCELFGITYLSMNEQSAPQNNFHKSSYYNIIATFIDEVRVYTGSSKVDIVGHSLGSTMALATIKYDFQAGNIRKFINIVGSVRGLQSCLWVGYANPLAPTCGSQNAWSSYVFGLYPDNGTSPFWGIGGNNWTGSSGSYSLRRAPYYYSNIDFYTINAGQNDQILCSTLQGVADCTNSPLFNNYANVLAQFNVGAGLTASQLDYDFSDWSIFNTAGGDANGVGHFRTKNNTGEIIYEMLNTNCRDQACTGTYIGGPVVVQ